jgi:hypothetical protein
MGEGPGGSIMQPASNATATTDTDKPWNNKALFISTSTGPDNWTGSNHIVPDHLRAASG